MKKSISFLLIVAFIISIFVVHSIGTAAHNLSFKSYFKTVEITDYDKMSKFGGGQIKDKLIYLQTEGETVYQIQYRTTPDESEVTEGGDGYEFLFDVDGGTHENIHGDQVPNCEFQKKADETNSNILTFHHECTVIVRLQTVDGSNLYDLLKIRCRVQKAS